MPLTLQAAPEAEPVDAAGRWPQSVAEFEVLVEAVQDELVHFAFCRLRSLEDAEDAVQEVLVRAYLERVKRRTVTGVRPYLFRMVANRCTDVLRQRQRAERRRDPSDPADLAARTGPESPVDRLEDMLFGVSLRDPLTFAAVIALMLAAALVASYVPARRTTKVDPMVSLRYE